MTLRPEEALPSPDPAPAPREAAPAGRSRWIGVRPTGEPGEAPVWPRPGPALTYAILIAYGGVAVLRPALPANTAYVDPLILLLSVISLVSMTMRGSPATRAATRILPWLWLVLIGSLIGLSGVGITGWALSNLLRTSFALLTFFAFWHLLAVTRLERAAVWGTAIGLGYTSISLLAPSATLRGAAFFPHPNYAGHFSMMAGVTLLAMSKTWAGRILAVVGIGVGIWQTASFGAMAMGLAMLGVVVFRSLKRSTAVLTLALIVFVIVGMFLAAPGSDGLPSVSGWDVNEVISEDRFDRSQGSRLEIWGNALSNFAEEPWGFGPDGVAQRGIGIYNGYALEVHADALGYLVERGILGLVGFIGFWWALWRNTRNGGLAHLLIVGMLVQGLFRETMHYRHMWLLVALACVWDATADERSPAPEPAAADPLEPGSGGAPALPSG